MKNKKKTKTRPLANYDDNNEEAEEETGEETEMNEWKKKLQFIRNGTVKKKWVNIISSYFLQLQNIFNCWKTRFLLTDIHSRRRRITYRRDVEAAVALREVPAMRDDEEEEEDEEVKNLRLIRACEKIVERRQQQQRSRRASSWSWGPLTSSRSKILGAHVEKQPNWALEATTLERIALVVSEIPQTLSGTTFNQCRTFRVV